MEYKQIRAVEEYPGSPHLTLSRFHGPSSKNSLSTNTEDVLLLFDVSFVEEHEMDISFPEPLTLQVSFKHGFKNTGRLDCGRDCIYTFKFCKHIKVEDLVAQWTTDDFLVIREKKSTQLKKSDKETEENRTSGDLENTKPQTSSFSSSIKAEEKLIDDSCQIVDGKNEVAKEFKELKETECDSEKEIVIPCPNTKSVPRLFPQKVDKIYKPIVSVSELNSVMSDIENRMLFVKNVLNDQSSDVFCDKIQQPLDTISPQK